MMRYAMFLNYFDVYVPNADLRMQTTTGAVWNT